MGRRHAASVDWATGGDDDRELDAGRQQVREEVRRMRKAGPLGDVERREWLADLATRLKALVRHLRNHVPASALALLNELLEAIEAGGVVDRLWDEAVTVLDAFAAGATDASRLPGAIDSPLTASLRAPLEGRSLLIVPPGAGAGVPEATVPIGGRRFRGAARAQYADAREFI